MHNSVIRKGKVTLYLTDTGRNLDLKKIKKLEKDLIIPLEVIEKFLNGKTSDEIYIKQKIELSLTMCGNSRIKTLNMDYRGKDKVTDVLSFPMFESLRNKKANIMLEMLETVNLGDIVISKTIALKQSKEFKISYEQEVIHLLIHGVLHLLGFDHELSKKEEDTMEHFEQLMVKKIYKKLGLKGVVETHG